MFEELIGYTTLMASDNRVPTGWHKETSGVASANGAIVSYYTKTQSTECGNEPYLGQIMLFSDRIVPQGWHACDGKILIASYYMALHSLIGARFGGNESVFALPNLPKVGGVQYIICLSGVYPS